MYLFVGISLVLLNKYNIFLTIFLIIFRLSNENCNGIALTSKSVIFKRTNVSNSNNMELYVYIFKHIALYYIIYKKYKINELLKSYLFK